MSELTVEQRLELLELERDTFHSRFRCCQCPTCKHSTFQNRILDDDKGKRFECLTCGTLLRARVGFDEPLVVG